jgi:sugar/nucleoside kinase (ribokinase family)
MNGGSVVALGDAVIDVIVEMAQPLEPNDDVPASIGLGLGGQAANVAAWCAYLGLPSAVIAPLGSDPTGWLIHEALTARGIEWLGPEAIGRSGAVVSLVAPGGGRSMLSDRGASAALDAGTLRPEWFERAGWLHLSGYALFGSVTSSGAALAAAGLARAAGARVSVDVSAATLLRSVGAERARRLVEATGAELVFANETEAGVLGPLYVPVLVVKRGPAGCRIIGPDGMTEVPAAPGAVVRDTTGAGDAFAAGWLVGGVDLALQAARTCVGLLGATPPTP